MATPLAKLMATPPSELSYSQLLEIEDRRIALANPRRKPVVAGSAIPRRKAEPKMLSISAAEESLKERWDELVAEAAKELKLDL